MIRQGRCEGEGPGEREGGREEKSRSSLEGRTLTPAEGEREGGREGLAGARASQ